MAGKTPAVVSGGEDPAFNTRHALSVLVNGEVVGVFVSNEYGTYALPGDSIQEELAHLLDNKEEKEVAGEVDGN